MPTDRIVRYCKSHPFFGRGLFLVSEGLFAFSFFFAKIASLHISFYQLMWFRFAPVIFLIPGFLTRKHKLSVANPPLMVLRSILGVTSIFCLLISLKWGEFGRANVIYSLGTLWAFFWSLLFLKERPHPITWLAVPMSFIGLFCMFQPSASSIQFPDGIALVGSALTAAVYVALRTLRKNHSARTIVFCFYSTGFVIFSVLCLIHLQPMSLTGFLLASAVGISGLLAQLFMTSGYKYCPVTVSSFIKLTNSVLLVIVGIFFFKDSVNILELGGMGMVFLSIFLITRYQ